MIYLQNRIDDACIKVIYLYGWNKLSFIPNEKWAKNDAFRSHSIDQNMLLYLQLCVPGDKSNKSSYVHVTILTVDNFNFTLNVGWMYYNDLSIKANVFLVIA